MTVTRPSHPLILPLMVYTRNSTLHNTTVYTENLCSLFNDTIYGLSLDIMRDIWVDHIDDLTVEDLIGGG